MRVLLFWSLSFLFAEMEARRDWAGMMGMPAAAGGIAVCFSHPLELTKVRLQLDNERAALGTPRMCECFQRAPYVFSSQLILLCVRR